MIQLMKKSGRITIDLTAIRMGQDLCVMLTGGDRPHLGVVTIAAKGMDAQTLAFGTHKERFVTEPIAQVLSQRFSGHFVICCGIHVDQITKPEIDQVKVLSMALANDLCVQLNERGDDQ
ncbi:hypothetical protein NOM01_09675 [Sporolactobacillus sp. STSJ-5]|uniref:prenylated flavin chaperone LpdD n=1 Tax=Sporolactobacillus sp. STSJ-5 TaxID=2965076 RepID=UPI002104B99A|nr:hypothetical protein [Sporolactobacillus sp. STSJ-5]MCQ2010282.1 hypothetical protein [Sporolactobacillus sp. STSJ-5]